VHLKVAGARALLRVPMTELTDHVVDGEALLGRSYRECRDRLAACRAHRATLACLIEWLERELVDDPPPRRLAGMVAALQREATTRQIDRIADGAGVSPRQLDRLFAGEVGVPPKQVATMFRFLRATTGLDGRSPPPLAALAQACGYYDQAQLTRDFRRHAGMTPSEYRARPRPVPSHVAL
jgi:transcriptional regulator GlxA family with amidase domain